MLGFKQFESASRFCNALGDRRNYPTVRPTDDEHVPAEVRRKIFTSQVVDSNDRAVRLNTGIDHVFGSIKSPSER